MNRLKLHIAFLIFTCASVFGQKPVVLLEVEPQEAEFGEILTLTVKSNVQGDLDIDLPPGFVHGYNVMNGMEQEMDYSTGKVITFYYMSQTGAMTKEGTYLFGPAYIKKGNKVYRSNTVNVSIKKVKSEESSNGEVTSRQLKQPAFGVIQKSRNTIYEGEPLVVSAKIYSKFSPNQLENYEPFLINGVIDQHEIGQSSRIMVDEERIKGISLYSFTYDKKVIFPSGTGKIEIEPFKLLLRRGYESFPVTSTSSFITIKSLPTPPKDFAGGVGNFSVSREISKSKLTQGEVFTMSITVEGYGNIHNLMEPKLDLPKGFTVYGDPIVTEEYEFGPKGSEGKIIYVFNIKVSKSGNLNLPGTSFSYFDPIKEKYVSVKTGEHNVKVIEDPAFKPSLEDNEINENASAERISFHLRPESKGSSKLDIISSPLYWGGLISPILCLLFYGLMVKKQDRNLESKVIHQKKKNLERKILDETSQAASLVKVGRSAEASGILEKLVLKVGMDQMQFEQKSTMCTWGEIKVKLCVKDASTINELDILMNDFQQSRYGLGTPIDELRIEKIKGLLLKMI
jgi:hypothetical protein